MGGICYLCYCERIDNSRGNIGREIEEHEVIVHGVDHAQSFQGCGLAFTQFEEVVTGTGADALEAFEDALEALSHYGWDVGPADSWDDKPSADEAILPDDAHDELWVYVSVRVR